MSARGTYQSNHEISHVLKILSNLEQGSKKSDWWAKFSPQSIFLNKVLLEHSYLLIYTLSIATFTMQQQCWTIITDLKVRKSEHIYHLALYRKYFLTSGLDIKTGPIFSELWEVSLIPSHTGPRLPSLPPWTVTKLMAAMRAGNLLTSHRVILNQIPLSAILAIFNHQYSNRSIFKGCIEKLLVLKWI